MGAVIGLALFLFIFMIASQMYGNFYECALKAEMENDAKRLWSKYKEFKKDNQERKEKWDS